MTLRGAYTALITPFTADGSAVDLDRLADNIRYQAACRVAGVVPCGTTGEAPTLTDQEHRVVVEKTVETAKPAGLLVGNVRELQNVIERAVITSRSGKLAFHLTQESKGQ